MRLNTNILKKEHEILRIFLETQRDTFQICVIQLENLTEMGGFPVKCTDKNGLRKKSQPSQSDYNKEQDLNYFQKLSSSLIMLGPNSL